MNQFALLLALVATASAAAVKPPPNIVVIVSDDHSWTDYSFMGHPQIRTPNLDRLASQSLVFPRGYVTSSICAPTLATLITGLYPHQHGIVSNDPRLPAGMKMDEFKETDAFEQGRERMAQFLESVPTLPRMLSEKGYLSFQTGKWWQKHFSRGGFTHGMSEGGRHGDAGLDIGRKTMQPIFDFIGDARGQSKPFFVWYAPYMPHRPHSPPERLLQKYAGKTPSRYLARYWAMVEWMDETCGELLRHLDEKGLTENTIVVYLADNGWVQDPESARSLARSKSSPYDGGLRTPIMMRWPGKIAPGRSDALASAIDIVPTLIWAAGIRPKNSLPGINLADSRAVRRRDTIFGECFTARAIDLEAPASSLCWRWMIEGNWKLIVPAPQNQPNESVELYDIVADPEERRDLAGEQRRRVVSMKAKLDQWWDGK